MPQNFAESISAGSSSRFKGVSWRIGSKKWLAEISINGKVQNLGGFDTEGAAARNYDEAACAWSAAS